jgi:hypothetical protein
LPSLLCGIFVYNLQGFWPSNIFSHLKL